MAAVCGLHIGERRRQALLRHIWRPRRFRVLLDRFAGRTSISQAHAALIDASDLNGYSGPEIGLRQRTEVEARIDALRQDAAEPDLSESELTALEALLAVQETLPFAHAQLSDIAVDLPQIQTAVEQLARRTDAMAHLGIDIDTLDFEASYGRTSMEYYDGFVFGFYAERRPDLPPLATGGRYDALTRQLGQGQEIPAVGGVLRPGLMLELEATET